MKAVAALIVCQALMGQVNPSIIFKAAESFKPIDVSGAMEHGARMRLMKEQSALLEAQRKALEKTNTEAAYKAGFADGSKAGFEEGKQSMVKSFEAYLPTLEQQIVANTMKMVYSAPKVDLERLLEGLQMNLEKNPSDPLALGMTVLIKNRIAELTPPPPPPEPVKTKPKRK